MANRYAETVAARCIDRSLAGSGRTAREVAEAAGMQPNHVSMIRTGAVAVPPERCAPLARELGVDPAEMVALCLRSYADHRSWRAIGTAFGL